MVNILGVNNTEAARRRGWLRITLKVSPPFSTQGTTVSPPCVLTPLWDVPPKSLTGQINGPSWISWLPKI